METLVQPQPATQLQRASAKPFYRPELDVLRFLAFTAVFFHHAFPHAIEPMLDAGAPWVVANTASAVLQAGGFGVDLFFVLSAYLITELLIRERELTGRIDIQSFYVRRTLRIWPLYFAFVLLGLVVLPRFAPSQRTAPEYAVAFLTFFANWAIAFMGSSGSILGPLWSVSIEEQFYCVWPIVVRRATNRALCASAVGMLLVASVTRFILCLFHVPHLAVWCNTLARLDPLAMGILLAVWLRGGCAPCRTCVQRISLLGSVISLIAAMAVLQPFARRAELAPVLITYPLAALTCAIIFVNALTITGPMLSTRAAKTFFYLGKISYGLYVFHLLCITASRKLHGSSVFAQALLSFCVTILLAVLSYELFEKPFLRLKQRFSRVESRCRL
ncbi:MAG: acyltransferase family protein [Terriglobales bacterium]